MDFKEVSSVPADPEGKQQHVVETLNVVDVGTSMVVEAVVRDDFTNETVLWALTHTFLTHGLPERLTFDRDPRFVGSWSGRDFPSAVMRFLLCLGLDAQVCPPQRPDLNALSSAITAATARNAWLWSGLRIRPRPTRSPNATGSTSTGSAPTRR
jgi:hypothetical protein